MDWLQIGLAALGGSVVTAVPVLVKAYLDVRTARTDADLKARKEAHDEERADRQSLIDEHEKARLNLLKEYDQLREEMRKEIHTLRDQITRLQEMNIQYAMENVNCKARIKELEAEVGLLKRQLGMPPGPTPAQV